MKPVLSAIGLTATVAAVAACAAERPPAPEMGRALFAEHCVICHGSQGRGDGMLAEELPVTPADLTGIAARNGGVFPWSDVMAKIHGYSGRADVMPEFGTVLSGPTLMWTNEEGVRIKTPRGLLAIAEYLASIQV